MRTFIENYLHFMKNCIRPHYEKLKPLKSGLIENSNFENNRDPWSGCKCVVNNFTIPTQEGICQQKLKYILKALHVRVFVE